MNRWRRWAGDLRRRHARREGRGPFRTMTLAGRASIITGATTTVRRTIVDLHAPLTVTLLRAALAGRTATAAAPPSTGVPGAPAAHAGGRTAPALAHHRPRIEPRAPAPAAPAFAPAPTLPRLRPRLSGPAVDAAPMRRCPVRLVHAPPLRLRAGGIERAAADLPTRLKARAVREDLPVRTRTVALQPPVAAVPPSQRPAAADPPPTSSGRPPWLTPLATAPVVDVEALTNQVVQQLDRRLIAYRERMGRA